MPKVTIMNPLLPALSGYFDDSGTHPNSEIVLMGGLMGNKYQWNYFSERWSEKLQTPSLGRGPLSRFHMFDCQNGIGEFAGWGRTATDLLVHELQTIILDAALYGGGVAVDRKSWDKIVTGELQTVLGDAEGFSLRQCYFMAEMWANDIASQREMQFVFDNRPQRQEENKKVAQVMTILAAYEEEQGKTGFAPVGHFFADSTKTLPLQGADLVAWEMYQHALTMLRGQASLNTPVRPQMKRLLDGGRITFSAAIGDGIKQFVESIPPEACDATSRIAERRRPGLLAIWRRRAEPVNVASRT